MGFWGTTLYANDCAADIRDDYKKFLQNGLNNDEALQKILHSQADRLNSEEEPLVWYALADSQWNLGRLTPEVKEHALWWIERDGGMCFWDGNTKQTLSWKKTLVKLLDKLNSPQPPEKKIKKEEQYVKNPWNAGDVYAYRFHTEEARAQGCYGKYILLQKLQDNQFFGDTFSLIQVYDKVYDEFPASVSFENLRLLPFSLPKTFMPTGKNKDVPKLAMSAVLAMDKKQHYPHKYLTYLCTVPVAAELYNRITWGYLFDWNRIEHTLLFYHSLWKEYVYELLENESVVIKKSQDT